MDVLQPVADLVTKKPQQVVAIFVLITLLLGYAASTKDEELVVDESSFLPDTPVANADVEIREEYGQVESVTILVKGRQGDVLSQGAMVELLELERTLAADPMVKGNLTPSTPQQPAVASLADFLAMVLIADAAAKEGHMGIPILGLEDQDYQTRLWAFQGRQNVTQLFANLSGGAPFMANFNMTAQTDTAVKQLVLDLAQGNKPGFEEQAGFLGFMLTKDFDPTVTTPAQVKAKATLMNIDLDYTLRTNEDSENEAQDRLLVVELKIDDHIEAQGAEHIKVSQLGDQIVNYEIEEATEFITGVLFMAAILLIFVILAITFRSIVDLFLGIGGLFLTIMWVSGFEAIAGFAPSEMSNFIPVMLMGLAVDYVIHMILRYREEFIHTKNVPKSANIAVFSVGSALLLATFTTVVGFSSNATSSMSVLRDFGLTVAFGILSAFLIFTMLVPALKLIIDSRKVAAGKNPLPKASQPKEKGDDDPGFETLDRFLAQGAISAEKRPNYVILTMILITLVMGALASQVRSEFSIRDFLPDDLEITNDFDYLFDEFNFSAESSNILIKGDLTDEAIFEAMRAVEANMIGKPHIVQLNTPNGTIIQITSVLTLMEEWKDENATFAQAFKDADTDGDELPDTNVTTLYDMLYELDERGTATILHKDDNGNYDGMVMRIPVDSDNLKETAAVTKELNDAAKPLEDLEKDGTLASVTVTSGPVLGEIIIGSINETMLSSLGLTIAIALIVLTLIFYKECNSWILGFLTTAPVLLVLVWIMGTMFLMGIPLNVITLLIGALTVGLGITYAIHITHRFIEELEEHQSIERAARHTVKYTGTALFGAAVTTMSGFGLLSFAIIPPMRQFGMMTAITILYSFLASVFILPTFLVMWARYTRAHLSDSEKPLAKVPEPKDKEETEEEQEEEASEDEERKIGDEGEKESTKAPEDEDGEEATEEPEPEDDGGEEPAPRKADESEAPSEERPEDEPREDDGTKVEQEVPTEDDKNPEEAPIPEKEEDLPWTTEELLEEAKPDQ